MRRAGRGAVGCGERKRTNLHNDLIEQKIKTSRFVDEDDDIFDGCDNDTEGRLPSRGGDDFRPDPE